MRTVPGRGEAAEREAARLRGLWRRWPAVRPVRDWAREVLADASAVVLDLETTGLGPTALVVEIGIYTTAGEKVLDTLVNPGKGESIPAEATAIHGITDADVADARTFGELLPEVTAALAGRRIVIYNRSYDEPRLAYELDRHHRAETPLLMPPPEGELHPAAAEWIKAQRWDRCAMQAYAVHYGDWSEYWGSYTWQPLAGGHRAGGDCRAVIERLREVAQTPDPAWPLLSGSRSRPPADSGHDRRAQGMSARYRHRSRGVHRLAGSVPQGVHEMAGSVPPAQTARTITATQHDACFPRETQRGDGPDSPSRARGCFPRETRPTRAVEPATVHPGRIPPGSVAGRRELVRPGRTVS